MSKTISKISNKRKMITASILCMLMMLPMATFCDANSVIKGVVEIIFDVARYVGVVLGVSGIFQLILAYKDDNADGQSRAVRLVVVALVLFSLKTFVEASGILNELP